MPLADANMTRKNALKNNLIAGLFLISLGGFLLHLRIHPLHVNPANYVPFIAGIVASFIVPFMFFIDELVPYAYMINGILAIIGTITMAHFSFAHFPKNPTFMTLLTNTLFADIAILWAKFVFGKAIFDLAHIKSDTDVVSEGRFARFPNTGFWAVHLIGFSIVYSLGHILWR